MKPSRFTEEQIIGNTGLGSPVTQAHIHFGKMHVAGGIIAFLCSNLANPPPETRPCPANGGTVTGTLTAASIVGPAAQNIVPGNFDALVEALDSNTAYGNIHTTQFPAGKSAARSTAIIGEYVRDNDPAAANALSAREMLGPHRAAITRFRNRRTDRCRIRCSRGAPAGG